MPRFRCSRAGAGRARVHVTDPVSPLSELLERCRGKLHAIDGVVGSGVGLTRSGHVAIQLFVRSAQDAAYAERQASELLADIPVEVVVSGDVTAADNKRGEEHA
jgi:hypothetical protein